MEKFTKSPHFIHVSPDNDTAGPVIEAPPLWCSRILSRMPTRDFPIHTALTIVLVGFLIIGIRLVSPGIKGSYLAKFPVIAEVAPRVSPLLRGKERLALPTSPVRLPTSTILFNDSSGTLDHFYRALWRTENGEQGAVTRITHYGDSPTTGDLITGDVRSILQSRFGNAGDGFVLIEKPWAWYQHRGVDLIGLGWQTATATAGHFEVEDGMFGLGGGSFTGSASASSRILFRRAHYSEFEVWFLRQPGGGKFTVSTNRQILGDVDTSGDSKSPGFAAFRTELPASEVSIRVQQGSVRLFGITAENPNPGVVYDSLGLNGASVVVLARTFNEAHWAEELRHRHPDLLIVNYGTNEAGFTTFVDKGYEVELREAIRRIHSALPNSSVLIMSPMDRGQKAGSGEVETMPTIPRIVNIQRRVADETGCAFFDTFDAMGGEGTMARWYSAEPRLVAADLIHPFGDGGKIIASLLTKELLAGLARFKNQHGFEDSELVMPKSSSPKEQSPIPRDSASADTRTVPSSAPIFHGTAARTPAHPKGGAPAETRNQFRLHGKGPIIVLAEERSASEELLVHPESLHRLIQSGLLFAVSDGTLVEITETQGDWIRIIIMEGQMQGSFGWIASKQVRSWR
jgi:lysophospholipase L1-like esterase